MTDAITIQHTIKAPIERVFDALIKPKNLLGCYLTSKGWKMPRVKVDPRSGGKIDIRFQDRTGTESLDFTGTYTNVQRPSVIEYCLDDKRTVNIRLERLGVNKTRVLEVFETGSENLETQKSYNWGSQLKKLISRLEKGNQTQSTDDFSPSQTKS